MHGVTMKSTCVHITAACGETWQAGALNVKKEVTGSM